MYVDLCFVFSFLLITIIHRFTYAIFEFYLLFFFLNVLATHLGFDYDFKISKAFFFNNRDELCNRDAQPFQEINNILLLFMFERGQTIKT